MLRLKTVLVLGLMVAVLGWSGAARATLCYMPAKPDGTGKPILWPSMPITYKINASKVAAADKDAFLTAVRAAFTSWTQVTCSNIQFTDGGESTSVDSASLGIILVNFSDQNTGSAYLTNVNIAGYDPPNITDALIQMNLKTTSGTTVFTYSVGAKVANSFDLQTVTKDLIAMALGFCEEVKNGHCVIPTADWQTGVVNIALSADDQAGARFNYFKNDSGCTQTTQPPACAVVAPAGDGAKTGDGVKTGDRGPTKYDGLKAGDGAKKGDGSTVGLETLPPPNSDKGCCRVSHAADSSWQGLLALAGLALLLALHRRRRG